MSMCVSSRVMSLCVSSRVMSVCVSSRVMSMCVPSRVMSMCVSSRVMSMCVSLLLIMITEYVFVCYESCMCVCHYSGFVYEWWPVHFGSPKSQTYVFVRHTHAHTPWVMRMRVQWIAYICTMNHVWIIANMTHNKSMSFECKRVVLWIMCYESMDVPKKNGQVPDFCVPWFMYIYRLICDMIPAYVCHDSCQCVCAYDTGFK